MCSVVGSVGKNTGRQYILEALQRLEYRGYDSAGFACIDSETRRLECVKTSGDVVCLSRKLADRPIDGSVSVGHTRWSTNGVVSDENAHPHIDCRGTLSVVHNGIIENHHELRSFLTAQGHLVRSQTDTELAAHLLEHLIAQHSDLKSAVIDFVSRLKGAFVFVFLLEAYPDMMLVIRKRSPLCIGKGNDQMYVSSDVLAFSDKTPLVCYLPDESFAFVAARSLEMYDFQGKPLEPVFKEQSDAWIVSGNKHYEHMMLKEIFEQRSVIHKTVDYIEKLEESFAELVGISDDELKMVTSLSFVACGTSWYASRIAHYFFESFAHVPAHALVASELLHETIFVQKNELCIALSQSGETRDTLDAMYRLKEHGRRVFAVTNVPTSTMVRESDARIFTQAGPEIAVASTKAFTAQLSLLYWFAHKIGLAKGYITREKCAQVSYDLRDVAEILEATILRYKEVIANIYAPRYAQYDKFIFLGRHISFPFAQEAALKLKEISYVFAECYPAGELKHGALALVDETVPVVLFSVLDEVVYQKLLVNAHAVKSRRGHLIVFAFEGQNELISLADTVFIIPRVAELLAPLAMTGLMQFFVYSIAKVLNRPIDKPRNLAKSVTVE